MNNKLWLIAVALVFLLGLGLRLYDLGGESLWVDEIDHARVASFATWHEVLRYDMKILANHMPLNDSLMRFCGLKADMSEFWWRLPSALFGAATIILLGFAVRRMFGPTLGLVTAFTLAVAPFHITKASQEANVYGIQVFMCVAALLTFVYAYENGGVWRWALFTLSITLALYSQMLSLFFACWFGAWAGVYGVWMWFRGRSRGSGGSEPIKKAAATVMCLALAMALFLVWFIPIGLKGLQHYTGGNWPNPTMSAGMVEALSPLVGRQTVPALAFIVLCALGAGLLPRSRSKWTLFVYGWLGSAIPVLVSGWVTESRVGPQYLFAAFPALCLLAAQGALLPGALLHGVLSRLGSSAREGFRGLYREGSLAVVLACVIVSVDVYSPLRTAYTTTEKEPWRQMSAYLAERVKENDIVVCSPPWSLDCMKYYQARLSKPLPLWNWDALITATPEQLEQFRAHDGNVWYLAKGYLPKKERLEGQQFPAYCVYRYDNVTTKTADFRGVAEELAGGAGSSDLVVKQMAVALQGKGEHQKVIELLEDHLRKPIAHTYMDMWGVLARSYADTGQLDKAVEAYKTCAASQTGDERAWAWYRAVCVYFNDKQYDAALEEGLALAKEFPNYVLIYYVLARCYEARKDWDNAYACFVKNAGLQPKNPYALRLCGAYHLQHGKLDEAEAALKRTLKLDPISYPDVYVNLAKVHSAKQDPAKMKETFEKGVSATWNPGLVLLLAQILHIDGQDQERTNMLRKALEMYLDNADLKAALAGPLPKAQ